MTGRSEYVSIAQKHNLELLGCVYGSLKPRTEAISVQGSAHAQKRCIRPRARNGASAGGAQMWDVGWMWAARGARRDPHSVRETLAATKMTCYSI
jgi:hypothetical protein